ncbi:acid protease, partial [Phlegmacium glaucopus]
IQQQHTNRGIKRLALKTGGDQPTEFALLSKLHNRLSFLGSNIQQRYRYAEIVELLSVYKSLGQDGGSEPSSSTRSTSRLTTRNLTGAPAGLHKSLHSIGLDIESNDIGYMATMQIGTPPRDFRLLVDSGSADLWVGAEGCRRIGGGDCGSRALLGSNSSTSFNNSKEEWAIRYASGTVSGFLVRDDVTIAGLTLKAHRFGVASNESEDFTSDSIPFDGLVGFATSIISKQNVPTLLESLYTSNFIPARIVSYKLSRLIDGKNDGELTLGGMDPTKYYPKTLVTKPNLNVYGFWEAAVDAVHIGSNDLGWSNRTIIPDTGTTLIVAPKADVDAIHNLIPGAKFDGGGWTVPCNLNTSLSLTISGQAFSIEPRDMVFYPVDPGFPSRGCMSGIGIGGVWPFYLNTQWLVGDVFLKNVYFSTDETKNTISFAKAKP